MYTKLYVSESESRSVVSDSLRPSPWILQVRILEWVAFPFSRGSSQLRDWSQVSRISGGFFTSWTTREALCVKYNSIKLLGKKRQISKENLKVLESYINVWGKLFFFFFLQRLESKKPTYIYPKIVGRDVLLMITFPLLLAKSLIQTSPFLTTNANLLGLLRSVQDPIINIT